MKSEELNPRIRIRSPLRCDGIGRLDCAEDVESGARLAVRWLPLDANGDAAVRACAKLPEHPTLPRVRQTGQMGDKAFLAMEFPDGKLLSTLQGEPLSADLLVDTGAQIADALATVHSQGVFHGELSLESVLLAKGRAYLWDMPLVIANRLTDRRGEERLMHQLVRTAAFLAPERARGAAPTPEGDVYGLAAVLCVAGGTRLPSEKSTLALVHDIVSGAWAPDVPDRYRQSTRQLLSRMLAKEPSARPTAREVADVLGKPAAVPTIPEMPAIVVPRAPAKTHFAAAPGALEPMLPPKAVADAAVKAAALNHKPLAVTVPSEVESTVKVSVPVQVLAAMSQPVAVDAELKSVIESMRPVNPATALPTIPAFIPSTKTLEFGRPELADAPVAPLTMGPAEAPASKEKTVASAPVAHGGEAKHPPAEKATAPAKEKTPPPAAAARLADVAAALSAAPPAKDKAASPVAPSAPAGAAAAPASALFEKLPPALLGKSDDSDVPAAAITAPNGPAAAARRASQSMPTPPVLGAVPASADVIAEAFAAPEDVQSIDNEVPTEAALKPSVSLQDNVAVSGETYAAGAEALTDQQAAGLAPRFRRPPTTLLAAAVLAVLSLAAGFGLRSLGRPSVKPAVTIEQPVVAPAVAAQPLLAPAEGPQQAFELDELGALPQRRRANVRRAPPSPAKLQGKYDSHNEPAPLADDFSFLNAGPETTKEDLKRPDF